MEKASCPVDTMPSEKSLNICRVVRTWRTEKTLRNRERVSFAHDRGCLFTLILVDDDQDFICADGRISAHGAVGHDQAEPAFVHSAAEQVGHIYGVSLPTVVSANDTETVPVLLVPAAVVRGTVVPVVAANIKQAHFDEAAFVKVEFALFASLVSCEDAQGLVFSNGGIAAHRLVVHRDSAVHSAPSDQVFENVGDIVALGPETIIRAHDLPALILGTHSCAENCDGNGENDHRDHKHSITVCELHSRLLHGGGPPRHLSHSNPAIAAGNAESRHSCPEGLQRKKAYFAERGSTSGETFERFSVVGQFPSTPLERSVIRPESLPDQPA